MPEYSYVREVHNDYWKKNLLIKFFYDGTLQINVSKVNRYNQNNFFSNNNHNSIIALQNKISNDELNNLYSNAGNFMQQAELIADILKLNSNILDGKLWKLTPLYKFLHTIEFSNQKNN